MNQKKFDKLLLSIDKNSIFGLVTFDLVEWQKLNGIHFDEWLPNAIERFGNDTIFKKYVSSSKYAFWEDSNFFPCSLVTFTNIDQPTIFMDRVFSFKLFDNYRLIKEYHVPSRSFPNNFIFYRLMLGTKWPETITIYEQERDYS